MARTFALSWYRPPAWAELLGKPVGRAVSEYHARRYDDVRATAEYINSLAPEFDCGVEVFT